MVSFYCSGSPLEWDIAKFSHPQDCSDKELNAVVRRPLRVPSDEALLDAVKRVVDKGRIYASDERVIDVALRIPRRVPKEISRKVGPSFFFSSGVGLSRVS